MREATLAARHDALVRAVSDRERALTAVAPAQVRAYLAATEWRFAEVLDVRDLRVERWRHPRHAAPEGVFLVGPEAGDTLGRWWDVACACGRVEGRHPTLVLAAWLVGTP